MTELAILFWFYKKPLVCKNHLTILKKHNPGLKIYGLFGGKPSESSKYKSILNDYLDDFYAFPSGKSRWKWLNGDLMILDWYQKRGKNLPWDSLAIVQWDLLVLTDLGKKFEKIKKGQLYLSGPRTLENNLENRWLWTRPGSIYRKEYIDFSNHVRVNHGFRNKMRCCLFIFQIFPRSFLEKLANTKNFQLGFLEYKIPTYARIFKIPGFKKEIGCHWFDEEISKSSFPLNADSNEISKSYIISELEKKRGYRIFHPFTKIWKVS